MAETTTDLTVDVLAQKVELLTAYDAFVSKKLICCPPGDPLEALVDSLLPHAQSMYLLCKEALGG